MHLGLMRMLLDEHLKKIVDALGRVVAKHLSLGVLCQHIEFSVHIEVARHQCVIDFLVVVD